MHDKKKWKEWANNPDTKCFAHGPEEFEAGSLESEDSSLCSLDRNLERTHCGMYHQHGFLLRSGRIWRRHEGSPSFGVCSSILPDSRHRLVAQRMDGGHSHAFYRLRYDCPWDTIQAFLKHNVPVVQPTVSGEDSRPTRLPTLRTKDIFTPEKNPQVLRK